MGKYPMMWGELLCYLLVVNEAINPTLVNRAIWCPTANHFHPIVTCVTNFSCLKSISLKLCHVLYYLFVVLWSWKVFDLTSKEGWLI